MTIDNRHINRKILAASIAIAGSVNPALAEEKPDIQDEIVVLGTRADLKRALDVKRSAETIVDAIAAADIGKMPDQNIADSLQRVPGVQIQRNRGQAEEITIRGLPSFFTQTLVNGRPITTVFVDTLSNRNFQAYIFPSIFTSRLEVHKTGKVHLQEGGIAGSVDIVTHRAFDSGERELKITAQANHDSNNGDIGTDIAAIYSNVFADDTIGVTFGVNKISENQGIHRVRGGRYRRTRNEAPNRDLNGDGDFTDRGIVVIDSVVVENYNQERNRWSYLANAEWRPHDDFSLFSEVIYSDRDTSSPRESIRFTFTNTDTVSANQSTIDINGTEYVTRYHTLASNVTAEDEVQDRDAKFLTAQIAADWKFADNWSAKVSLSLADSQQLQRRFRAISRIVKRPEAIFTFDRPDDPHGTTLIGNSADLLSDTANYRVNQFNSGPGDNILNNMEQTDFRLDFTRSFDEGFIHAVDFGLSYSDSLFTSQRDRFRVSRRELARIGVANFTYRVIRPESGSFVDSSGQPQPGAFVVPNTRALIDAVGLDALIAADTDAVFNNPADIIDLDETFTSYYVAAKFGDSSGFFSGNFGIRYASTDEDSSGNSIDLSAGFTRDSTGALRENRSGAVKRSRSYSEVLPSLNLRFNIADNHVLRFAAAKTMSRPAPADLDLLVEGLSGGAEGESNLIRFNDPDLKPFLSTNLDLTYSWYYGEESLLSIGLYQKDLKSLIGTRNLTRNLNVTNEATGATALEAFNVTTRSNDEGVKLKGLELSWQQPFTGLPGLLSHTGVLMNYTYIDNSAPERLAAAAEDNYNLIVYYDDGKIDARVSYTFRGEYLRLPATGLEPSEFFSERPNLVASVSYNINNNLQARLSGRNLTDKADNRHFGPLSRQYIDYGRRISLNITGSF